mmetsp:Transcript_29952/g.63047  ORF Transcript_29952/g.63047 Transcript_29952/m.63047 type:complete len:282 (+) Transcript_29952:343-1188(+)
MIKFTRILLPCCRVIPSGIILFQTSINHFFSDNNTMLSLSPLQPSSNPVLCFGSSHILQPFSFRRLVDGLQDFNHVSILNLVLQRNHLPVHFCPRAVIPQIGMDLKRKIQHGRPPRQRIKIPSRRKDEDLLQEQVFLHRIHELNRIGLPPDFIDELAQPRKSSGFVTRFIATNTAIILFLVQKMSRDTRLCHIVHIPRSYLHFDSSFVRSNDGGVQTSIAVRFGQCHVIFDFSGYRFPVGVHRSQCLIARCDVVDNDSESDDVVYIVELDFLSLHFRVDRP